jgi:hypothetical protein
MPDTGEDIGEDPPPLKKVQRYIPGFRGYLQKDDVRDADRMLRMQLSQKISVARKNLEGAKASIEEKDLIVDISLIESALNSLKRMSSEIGYADSGYSWMASNSNPAEDAVERIYDYDAGLLDQITLLQGISSELSSAASDSDVATLERDSADIHTRLAYIEDLFIKRMAVMNRTGF